MKPAVISVGTGAGHALSWFNDEVWSKPLPVTIALDCDRDTLDSFETDQKKQIDYDVFSANTSPENSKSGKLVIQDTDETISELIDDLNPIVILVTLGGEFGTAAAPRLARQLQQQNKDFLCAMSWPYDHEFTCDEDAIESACRRLKFYSDQTFEIELSRLKHYLSRDWILSDRRFRVADQLLSNLLNFLFQAMIRGDNLDEEAYERICRMSSIQKHNLLMNIYAPGWHSGIQKSREAPEMSNQQTKFRNWLTELLKWLREWIIDPVKNLLEGSDSQIEDRSLTFREFQESENEETLTMRSAVHGIPITVPIEDQKT